MRVKSSNIRYSHRQVYFPCVRNSKLKPNTKNAKIHEMKRFIISSDFQVSGSLIYGRRKNISYCKTRVITTKLLSYLYSLNHEERI